MIDGRLLPVKKETAIRLSREQFERCPFAAGDHDKLLCSELNVRCGDRQQYSDPLASENKDLKLKPHQCLRAFKSRMNELTVLIIDNDQQTRHLGTEILKLIGIGRFLEAHNGRKAMTLIDAQKRKLDPVDVVVSDIHPGGESESWREMAGFIDERNHRAKVILLTNEYDSPSFNTPHKAIGAKLKKPFSFNDLQETLEGCLPDKVKT